MTVDRRGQERTMSQDKRLALVTGGTGGLGQAICKRLAADGFAVVALHTPGNPRVAEWLAACEREGLALATQPVDVADYRSCASAVDEVRRLHGPVSVLVNNAGITQDSSFRKMSLEQWQNVLRVNLDSMFNMSKQVIEDMIAAGWGRIVNISSVNAQRGAFGQCNYAASKAGIHGFTKSLAIEFAGKGMTVNTVSPGYLRTAMVERMPREVLESRILPQIPAGRLGEPDEIARLIAYLVSEHGAFVNGANLAINGGQHMA
jgi:acetoacetyl-CoA reductase